MASEFELRQAINSARREVEEATAALDAAYALYNQAQSGTR
ncbi:MAG TPA: hypothetical protein VFN07_11230 [Trueperaceae bacterium]|nr:hypothetical protein [Trueperaceae bacterium]